MTDTAQPLAAAETEVVPDTKEGQMDAAASSFKAALGQEDTPEPRPRAANGQFVSPNAEEIADEPEAQADAGGDGDGDDGGDQTAADEAQPDGSHLPTSWDPDKAELWETLEPDAQAYIRQRESERESAVNAKFMEAANLRKAHEAEIGAAQFNANNYAQLADQALGLIGMYLPPEPPRSMLNINSSDYDPDQYHYQKGVREDLIAEMNRHAAQRQQMAAQEQFATVNAINAVTRDKFIEAVPEVTDQAKAPAIFQGLIEYAVEAGAPVEMFQNPTSALEWHIIWKAREYDRLQKAKAKVQSEPAPTPRKPQPAVRPGVTTPRSTIERQSRDKAMDRLAKSGRVEDAAAVFKSLMKGSTR